MLRRILLPDIAPKFEKLEEDDCPDLFAYYTTAETAYKILANGEIWLRNASVMNDWSEVKHGLREVRQAYDGPDGKCFEAALNRCHPTLGRELRNWFDGWDPAIANDTFILCLSEHDRNENDSGRLSMWRAYGGSAGVCFVFKSSALAQQPVGLGAFALPVTYGGKHEISARLSSAATLIDKHRSVLQGASKRSS